MKNKLRLIGLGALCTSAVLHAACGDDDENPPAGGVPDAAGIDATSGPDGGTDAANPDGQVGIDASPEAAPDVNVPWCGNQRDGGALCTTGQWRDFGPPPADDAGDAAVDAGSCKACPTTPLTCASAVLRLVDGGLTFTPPTYDSATDKLTLTIPSGQMEVISVTNATAIVANNCFGGPNGAASGPQSVPATVSGDTITFDFSGTDAGTSAAPCGTITFTVSDACCTTSNVTVNAYFESEAGRITTGSCPDGG